jgi:hypothetical protein
MIRYSRAMTCLMAYHNKKGTESISIVLQTTCGITILDSKSFQILNNSQPREIA